MIVLLCLRVYVIVLLCLFSERRCAELIPILYIHVQNEYANVSYIMFAIL